MRLIFIQGKAVVKETNALEIAYTAVGVTAHTREFPKKTSSVWHRTFGRLVGLTYRQPSKWLILPFVRSSKLLGMDGYDTANVQMHAIAEPRRMFFVQHRYQANWSFLDGY
jgi:hypothetical protein